jgi:hypothetical protein
LRSVELLQEGVCGDGGCRRGEEGLQFLVEDVAPRWRVACGLGELGTYIVDVFHVINVDLNIHVV